MDHLEETLTLADNRALKRLKTNGPKKSQAVPSLIKDQEKYNWEHSPADLCLWFPPISLWNILQMDVKLQAIMALPCMKCLIPAQLLAEAASRATTTALGITNSTMHSRPIYILPWKNTAVTFSSIKCKNIDYFQPFLHKGFLSSIPAMDKKDSNKLLQQITAQLIAPQHFQKHEQGSLWSLCRACKADYAACMAIIQKTCRDAARMISILHCAGCEFLLLPCGTSHIPCTSVLIQERKNSICAVGQSSEPKEYGANHCLHSTPRISKQRLLAGSVASPGPFWCSVGKSQSKNEVSLQEAYSICCYEPWQKYT